MKHLIRQLSVGLTLLAASWASQAWTQSTLQQVQGSGWHENCGVKRDATLVAVRRPIRGDASVPGLLLV